MTACVGRLWRACGALAVWAFSAMPGHAQSVDECGWFANASFLAEPWADNTKVFANGAVRVALIDTVEPAAAPYRLLILSPPYSELGERQCATVGVFSRFDFAALTARYDPAEGLTVSAPVGMLLEYGDAPLTLDVTINQATGAIQAKVAQ